MTEEELNKLTERIIGIKNDYLPSVPSVTL